MKVLLKNFDRYAKNNSLRYMTAAVITRYKESDKGISYSRRQNGTASKMMNGMLIEMARCTIFYANLLVFPWIEAVTTAPYICNRYLTKISVT